ncbi:MAG: hypothetical protein HY696_08620 [Deltaproteobacteria bacterium]|nr:hypothetical protein [Deltaproteobacteria bacterium]
MKRCFCVVLCWCFAIGVAMGYAVAGEDCTLQLDGIHGALDTRSPLLKNYRQMDQRKTAVRRFTESAVLADGTAVSFETGGCQHIAYTLTYGPFAPDRIKSGEQGVALGIALLERTPFRADFPHQTIWLRSLRTIRTPPTTQGGFSIPLGCGDATCALEWTPAGQLSLSYDFAL